MPRFLPKLIQSVKTTQRDHGLRAPETGSLSSRRQRRFAPSALPNPNFSPHGRKQSILLDDVNPIMHPNAFTQHKLDPPIVPSVAGRAKHANSNRQVREMTNRECEWWSNPYLRMLASPLRQCIVTDKQLPADFMVRLAALEVPGARLSRTSAALLPDGVEHSRFRRHNSGKGCYIVCRRDSIDEMVSRSSYKRIPFAPSNIHVHSLLATQVGHQLRIRVLQELELLAESLRCAPQGSRENTVLRRLTRTEWAEIKTAGRISQPGAVAVVVVPPLRTVLDDKHDEPSRVLPPPPPLSILHNTHMAESTYNGSQSEQQVPLYNGLSLFPTRSLRFKLYKALQNTLLVERRARWRQNKSSHEPNSLHKKSSAPSRERDKASHAYLLRSDGNTIRRADSVPLATSLWRIRMWEGQGWEAELRSYGGWAAVNVKKSTSRVQ